MKPSKPILDTSEPACLLRKGIRKKVAVARIKVSIFIYLFIDLPIEQATVLKTEC